MNYAQPTDYHISTPDGTPASIRFYFGVKLADIVHLPDGAVFEAINSTNYYVHPDSPLHGWCWARFQVQVSYTTGRSYIQLDRQSLTPDETRYYAALWADAVGQGLAVAV